MTIKNEEKTAGAGFKPYILLFWFCVLGTAAMVVAGGWFFLQFMKFSDDIKGSVVLLEGVDPPATAASVQEVRSWIADFSEVLPHCRCTLGRPERTSENQALLFCVGLTEGDGACSMRPEKIPAGVSMKVSSVSDVGNLTKAVFLLDRFTSHDIIDPRTERSLKVPR